MTRVLPALVLCVVLALPGSAQAASCTFAGGTVTASGTNVLSVKRVGDAIELRSGQGLALLPCGNPSVMTVDDVNLTTSGGTYNTVTIDLSGGAFAPGATSEPYTPEIEFDVVMLTAADQLAILGGSGSDNVVVGTSGVNLNSKEGRGVDIDVDTAGVNSFVLRGRGGDDVVSLGGGSGTGSESSIVGLLGGGEGNDTVTGGAGNDSLGNVVDAETGTNSLSGRGGNDQIGGGPGDDSFDGGAGEDTISFGGSTGVNVDLALTGPQATGAGTDSFAGIETLYGSLGDDVLRGDSGANRLDGRDGNDHIQPRGGNDIVNGGSTILPSIGGIDTVDYSDAAAGVKIDLTLGLQDTVGSGADTLSYMEHIVGSNFADELYGDGGSNTIDGMGGVDAIVSRAGLDSLLIRDGGPDNVICGEDADTVAADDPGVDQIATDCETVAFSDTVAPQTTIDSGPDGETTNTTPSFSFSSNEDGSTFECSIDGGAYAACTSPTEIGPLGPGEHTFEVRAKDGFGNVDATPAKRTITLPPDGDADSDGDGGGGDGGGEGGPDGGPVAGGDADRRAPVVRKLSVSPRRFRVGRRPTALTAALGGTTFRYRLSETAVVSIAIQRCRAQKRKRCRTVGTLLRSARKGRNRTKFSGRLGRKALKAGQYRAKVTAVDPAGNRSRPVRVAFTVLGK